MTAQSFVLKNAAHAVATNAIKESRRKLFVLVQLKGDCNYSVDSLMNIILKMPKLYIQILKCNLLSKVLVCSSPLFPSFRWCIGDHMSTCMEP